MAAVERQPFGEVSTGRLQQLASAKNRQNGLFSPKDSLKGSSSVPTPTKRSYAMSSLGDDSENVDPGQSLSSSKKNKFELFSTPVKPSALFSPSKDASTFSEPRQLSNRLELSPSRTPISAPAGRSPKRKTIGLAKPRRAFMPYTRIDPPFANRSSSALPFSLDAALNSTLSAKPAPVPVKAIPSKWKFEIHEDTPEEEAATLMEHSTLTLDLSSDDEGTQEKKMDRGKENTPPEGYDAPAARNASSSSTEQATTPIRTNKLDIVRRKLDTDQMDDGQRTPLSDLDVEPFSTIEAGEDSYIVVEPDIQDATPTEAEAKASIQDTTSTQAEASTSQASPSKDFTFSVEAPVAPAPIPEVKVTVVEPASNNEIVIFEDESVAEATPAQA